MKVPPGSFADAPLKPNAAPISAGGGGFFTVMRKYFAVVAGIAIVCWRTAPGQITQTNLKLIPSSLASSLRESLASAPKPKTPGLPPPTIVIALIVCACGKANCIHPKPFAESLGKRIVVATSPSVNCCNEKLPPLDVTTAPRSFNELSASGNLYATTATSL